MTDQLFTFRRYKDGDHAPPPLQEAIFNADRSYKCPTYVHRTPPCQGSCPAGEDVASLQENRSDDRTPCRDRVYKLHWLPHLHGRMPVGPYPNGLG